MSARLRCIKCFYANFYSPFMQSGYGRVMVSALEREGLRPVWVLDR